MVSQDLQLLSSATNREQFATAGLKPLVQLLRHTTQVVVVHALKVLSALSFDKQIKIALLDQDIVRAALDLTKSKVYLR